MNPIFLSTFLVLVLLPVTTSVSCFVCSPGGNCNDPFTSTSISLASGVSISTGCSSCVKTGAGGSMSRACTTCPGVNIFVAGTGVACCSDKDLCNSAPSRFYNHSFAFLGLMVLILMALKNL